MKTNWLQTAFRILMGLLMTIAGIGHLTFQRQEFLAQVPRWISLNASTMDFIVLASGVIEIALGLAFVFWKSRKREIGLLLALFFLLVFPGNLSQYVYGIDGFGLDTDQKRFIRLFFQPVLIVWALGAGGYWHKTNNK